MTFGDVQRRLLYIQKHKYLSYLGLPRGDAYNVRIRVLPHVAHLPKFTEEVALGNVFGPATACKEHFRSVLGIRVEGVT